MLTDDQTQHLILSIEARTDKLDAALAGMVTNTDAHFRSLEASAQNSTKRIEGYMAQAGRRTAEGFLNAMGAVFAVRSIGGFIESVVESAVNIRKQASALDISTDAFQGWSLMAHKAGIDQDQFSAGLDHMVKAFEEAKIKGGVLAPILKGLIPDWRKLSPEQYIYAVADAIQKTDASMRAGVLGELIGGTGGGSTIGTTLAPFFAQGAASMQSQLGEFQQLKEIISPENLEKLQKLDDAWIDFKATLASIGATTLTQLTDKFSELQSGVESQNFQTSLKNIAKLIGDIATGLVKAGPYLEILGGAGIGKWFGGLPGAAIGAGWGTERTYDTQIREWMLKNVNIPATKLDISSAKSGFTLGNADRVNELERQLAAQEDELAVLEGRRKQVETDANGNLIFPGGTSAKNQPTAKGSPAGTPPPDPTAGLGAYDHAVQSIKAKIDAMKTGTDTVADYTAAEQAATEKAALLAAAESDAAKKGLDANAYVAARSGEIDRLASQYGALRAQQAWNGDLASEDARIAKLKAQAEAAGATARQLAELEAREQLMGDFHKRYGANATPNAAQQSDIDSRVSGAGTAAAGADFAKAVDAAQKQIDAMSKDNATVGLFGGALAEAKMRMDLLNAAVEAGLPIDAQMQATIAALARQMGEASQKNIDLSKTYADQVQITDELRNGLESTLMAGEHGFKSMGTAAKQFLLQLVELAVKIELLEPMLQKLFGPPGTAGGGSVGGFLNDIFGGGGSVANGSVASAGGAPGRSNPASSGSNWLDSAVNWVGNLFGGGDQSASGTPDASKPASSGTNWLDSAINGIENAFSGGGQSGVEDIEMTGSKIGAGTSGVQDGADGLKVGTGQSGIPVAPKKTPFWEQLGFAIFSSLVHDLVNSANFADGGIMTSRGPVPLRKYADGGIANSPQAAIFGEGSGPEAFVPLKNGGIPVHMKMPTIGKIPRGSLSSTTNVHVPINVDARGAQAGVAEQIEKKLADIAPRIVAQAVGASDARFHDNLHRTIRDRW